MLHNISEVEKEVTISKGTYPYGGIRGYLSATGDEVILAGEKLNLPPYTIVILK